MCLNGSVNSDERLVFLRGLGALVVYFAQMALLAFKI